MMLHANRQGQEGRAQGSTAVGAGSGQRGGRLIPTATMYSAFVHRDRLIIFASWPRPATSSAASAGASPEHRHRLSQTGQLSLRSLGRVFGTERCTERLYGPSPAPSRLRPMPNL